MPFAVTGGMRTNLTFDPGLLLDYAHLRAFLGEFDTETRTLILDAGRSDLLEWTERLIVACEMNDQSGIRGARHALRGLCSNFGASALLALCEADIGSDAEAEALRDCRKATFDALALGAATLD